jgi:putative Ca2+/H+ antiporter (TMEM165/GDT1 family)
MTALYVSFVVVALAEMGDKTQLVALTLASRYRRPWTVILGILIATLVNHALATSIGGWMAEAVPHTWLAWVLGLGLIAFEFWTLAPDRAVSEGRPPSWGPFDERCRFLRRRDGRQDPARDNGAWRTV